MVYCQKTVSQGQPLVFLCNTEVILSERGIYVLVPIPDGTACKWFVIVRSTDPNPLQRLSAVWLWPSKELEMRLETLLAAIDFFLFLSFLSKKHNMFLVGHRSSVIRFTERVYLRRLNEAAKNTSHPAFVGSLCLWNPESVYNYSPSLQRWAHTVYAAG